MHYYNDDDNSRSTNIKGFKIDRPSMFSPTKQKFKISRLEKEKNLDIMIKRFESKLDLFTGKPRSD